LVPGSVLPLSAIVLAGLLFRVALLFAHGEEDWLLFGAFSSAFRSITVEPVAQLKK
jgi:hypothetical protein